MKNAPKKQNVPTGSGRTFLRELVYHTNTFCQEKFCEITKILVSLLFSTTLDGPNLAFEFDNEEPKSLQLSLPQKQGCPLTRNSLLRRNLSSAASPQQEFKNSTEV